MVLMVQKLLRNFWIYFYPSFSFWKKKSQKESKTLQVYRFVRADYNRKERASPRGDFWRNSAEPRGEGMICKLFMDCKRA